MESKEYLETKFPDGTQVKIYPMKEQSESIEADAIEAMIALAEHSPVIEHGAVNAVYYKDLVVLSGKWSDEILAQFKIDYPQIKHIITIRDKYFDRWMPQNKTNKL